MCNVISSPILETLREQIFCVKFKITISEEAFCIGGFSFVDDKDLEAAGYKFKSNTEVTNAIQKSIDVWQGAYELQEVD